VDLPGRLLISIFAVLFGPKKLGDYIWSIEMVVMSGDVAGKEIKILFNFYLD
jgi:hypothetical protein